MPVLSKRISEMDLFSTVIFMTKKDTGNNASHHIKLD